MLPVFSMKKPIFRQRRSIGFILHQDACRETEKALFLRQIGDVREELISYSVVLVVISYGKGNVCVWGRLLYPILSDPDHFFFSPLFGSPQESPSFSCSQ